jgi:ATP-dependent DNA helicase RecG
MIADVHLKELLNELVKQASESEWLEFKHNYHSAEEIGIRLSALSNGACLHNQPYGYLVFGVEDKTHRILGTTFKPKVQKNGNEDLENWLANRLNPKMDFTVETFDYSDGKSIVIYIISSAESRPIEFQHQAYIRVGSVTRKLGDFPEKAAKIWRKETKSFEKQIASASVTPQDVIQLLSTQTYFDLIKQRYPTQQINVLSKFVQEGLIIPNKGNYDITKLAALLFAKDLNHFEGLGRKAIRAIVYRSKSKVATEREHMEVKGYALAFANIVEWVNSQLPANEEIGKVFREDTRMYPQIAIRELIANALIHQDFGVKGFPMIEIFPDRIEISNAGTPLITPERFIDAYLSRNEKLADLMRRMGFCEEKGSGLDKVIFYNELYQLPAINVLVNENRTIVVMYSYKTINDLDKKEKIRACYQHACLKYVSNEKMNNQSLRERFKIEEQNAATASRIIRDAMEEGVIKKDNPDSKAQKYVSYIPFWA